MSLTHLRDCWIARQLVADAYGQHSGKHRGKTLQTRVLTCERAQRCEAHPVPSVLCHGGELHLLHPHCGLLAEEHHTLPIRLVERRRRGAGHVGILLHYWLVGTSKSTHHFTLSDSLARSTVPCGELVCNGPILRYLFRPASDNPYFALEPEEAIDDEDDV
eukprot:1195067-Prorocentrum_minimum.AAC.1